MHGNAGGGLLVCHPALDDAPLAGMIRHGLMASIIVHGSWYPLLVSCAKCACLQHPCSRTTHCVCLGVYSGRPVVGAG